MTDSPDILEAEAAYTKALDGVVALYRAGRLEEAYALGVRLPQLRPDDPGLLHLIGGIAVQLGKKDEGVAYLSRAAELNPDDFDILLHLGGALHSAGRLGEAEAVNRRALEIHPDHGEALNNLGVVVSEAGRKDEAAGFFAKAAEVMPEFTEAHLNQAKTLYGLGRNDEAEAAYRRVLEADDTNIEALNGLGNALKALGKFEEAVDSYRKAIEVNPDHDSAHYNLGNALHSLSELAEARAELQKAYDINPSMGVRVRRALMMPIIPRTTAEVMEARRGAEEDLDAMIREGVTLDDPYSETRFTNFYLAYHGVNDRPLQQKISQFYLSACPDLGWAAPHCREGRLKDFVEKGKGRRIRIGIASAFFYGHTIGRLYRGVIENLDKEKFEIILFRTSSKEDADSAIINAAVDRVVTLNTESLTAARKQIAAEELDILFYPDIGMTSLTFFLAFSRLAPVQCVSWGHGVTTGVPNLDYFLSSSYLEPDTAEDHYSETLVRLTGFPMYCRPPAVAASQPGRAYYGLPEDANIYLCPHTLFKFQPDFDPVLGALLARDANGVLVLITDGLGGVWEKILSERFRSAFPEHADRVLFIDRQPEADFHGLLAAADVVIDTPQFTGGYTSIEAFAMAAPIVTWPGEFMRGQVTYGYYKKMGILDLVVDSAEELVETAYRLAVEPEWKAEICARIIERLPLVLEDMEVVREMGDFFASALAAAGSGDRIENWQWRK